MELQKFDGTALKVSEEQVSKLEPILLATGKFVKIDDEIVNISQIKGLCSGKGYMDYL